MAGSYNHCVTNKGNLMSNDRMMISGAMIENLGDAYEAIEEMFGMIWYLACKLDGPVDNESLSHEERLVKYNEVKLAVEEARENYAQGLSASRDIHAISPDNRRGGDNE